MLLKILILKSRKDQADGLGYNDPGTDFFLFFLEFFFFA